jgi:Ca2+-binding RTX toxin-like protein
MVFSLEIKLRHFCCLKLLSLTVLYAAFYYPQSVYGADFIGTDKDDTLTGTMADDTIEGKKGMDSLYGNGGNDQIDGDSGDDIIQGDAGNDKLNGNDGNDVILGGTGADKIDSGNGDDLLESNIVIGSTSVADGSNDTITCGSGIDTAFINPSDGDTASSDCETIISSP